MTHAAGAFVTKPYRHNATSPFSATKTFFFDISLVVHILLEQQEPSATSACAMRRTARALLALEANEVLPTRMPPRLVSDAASRQLNVVKRGFLAVSRCR